jgi:IPT/TIG domain/Bacterial Ig-like domain (group 1)
MVKRVFSLGTGAVGLVLIAVLLMGLAGPGSAFAATKRPVVKSISPASGTQAGGVRVTISGKYFRINGKSVVRKVMFGAKAGTKVRVTSATVIKVTAPGGKGRVNVRVCTSGGTSAQVAAGRFTYVGPATQIALKAGDGQTASLGTSVKVSPSVVVKDAAGHPVPGVSVTFAVASGGGSVTGSPARTDASGIAKVGGWKLGTTAGANTLTATSAGLAGSPVTFTATGDAGLLLVKLDGAAVRSYSLDELKALKPFAGWAGLNKTPALGPDAVTGAKITDVVADALGTPLKATQSVNVAEVDATPYDKTMTYDLLVNFTGITMYDATTKAVVASPAGPLAAVLVYSDPAGIVMPAATNGPLRFFIADGTNENLVFGPTNLSVSKVNVLNVINP